MCNTAWWPSTHFHQVLDLCVCIAADALKSGHCLLADVLKGGIRLFLGTALVLLSKLQCSSRSNPSPSNSTSQSNVELLRIVESCLESLLVTATTWSCDGAATTHSNATPQPPTMQQTTSWHAIRADNPAKQHGSHQPAVVPLQLLGLSPRGGKSWNDRSRHPTVVQAQPVALPPPEAKTCRSHLPTAMPVRFLALSPTGIRTSTYGVSNSSSGARSLPCDPTGLAPAISTCITTARPSLGGLRLAKLGASPLPRKFPVNIKSASIPSCNTFSMKNPCTGVYVGNLPKDTDERLLMELFSQYGCITKLWITWDPLSGASLGYGYVVFSGSSGAQAAQSAVRDLNGTCMKQQKLCLRISNRNFDRVDT